MRGLVYNGAMNSSSFEILAYESTPLGVLCLRRRELLGQAGTFVTEITLNQEFLMSSYNTDSECALADIALQMHQGNDLSVLVGGLGLGYTARAALQSKRVKQLQVIEFLPQVIRWLKDGLVPLSDELNSDNRLEVIQGDFYEQLSTSPERQYDLILIDIDHSPGEHLDIKEGNDAFYTEEGLKRAKEHLAPGGILGLWSYAESSPFAEALKNVFGEVRVEEINFRNTLVNENHTDWLFFVKGD